MSEPRDIAVPANLFAQLPAADGGEVFETLLRRGGVQIERIVSTGQVTPPDQPYQQRHDEWVVLLAGAARLRLDGAPERELIPGDHLLIPAGVRHWVTYSSIDPPAVWLAVHLAGDDLG